MQVGVRYYRVNGAGIDSVAIGQIQMFQIRNNGIVVCQGFGKTNTVEAMAVRTIQGMQMWIVLPYKLQERIL